MPIDWRLALGLGSGVLGAGVALRALWNLRRWWRVRSWPHVTGVIVHSRVRATGCGDDYEETADIAYEYEVDGEAYTGTRVRAGGDLFITMFAGDTTGEFSTARALQRHYMPTMKACVYYNPGNPAECALEKGGLLNVLAELALAAGLLAWSIYTLQAPVE